MIETIIFRSDYKLLVFTYKGQGTLDKPLKVAYAKEGAQIFDGHQTDNTTYDSTYWSKYRAG